MTTYESMRGHHHNTSPITNALVTGSLTTEGAQLGPAGAGPDPVVAVPHRQKEGCFAQWKKLLGLDTFIATALHGSKASEVMASRRQNPFTKGVFTNCSDFWCDAGGWRNVLKTRKEGVSNLDGMEVDYRRLYEVPEGGNGGGMRYRRGGYESVGTDENV